MRYLYILIFIVMTSVASAGEILVNVWSVDNEVRLLNDVPDDGNIWCEQTLCMNIVGEYMKQASINYRTKNYPGGGNYSTTTWTASPVAGNQVNYSMQWQDNNGVTVSHPNFGTMQMVGASSCEDAGQKGLKAYTFIHDPFSTLPYEQICFSVGSEECQYNYSAEAVYVEGTETIDGYNYTLTANGALCDDYIVRTIVDPVMEPFKPTNTPFCIEYPTDPSCDTGANPDPDPTCETDPTLCPPDPDPDPTCETDPTLCPPDTGTGTDYADLIKAIQDQTAELKANTSWAADDILYQLEINDTNARTNSVSEVNAINALKANIDSVGNKVTLLSNNMTNIGQETNALLEEIADNTGRPTFPIDMTPIDSALSDPTAQYDQVMSDWKALVDQMRFEAQNMFTSSINGGGVIKDRTVNIFGVSIDFSLNRFLPYLQVLQGVILFAAAFISAGIIFGARGE